MSPFKETGLPPGTVVYSGDARSEKVKITLMEYNEKEFIEKEFYDVDECFLHVKENMVKWLNVDGIHDTSLVEKIGNMFNIHPLTLEDIVTPGQRAKFEDYDHYLFAVMKMLCPDNEIHSEQLSIILTGSTVISFQEAEGGDAFDIIRLRLRQGKGRVRKMSADYLMYCLVDSVIDFYFAVLEKIGDAVEDMEEAVVKNPGKKLLTDIHRKKREVIFLRKSVWPMRDLVHNFERCENKVIKKTTRIFLRDAYDHSIRVIDAVETYRDLLSGMMDLYLSTVSNRMNQIIKLLTIITTIFIPLSFVAGIYGMNFDYMPELHWRYGYFIILALLFAIGIGMLFYFKRRKWL